MSSGVAQQLASLAESYGRHSNDPAVIARMVGVEVVRAPARFVAGDGECCLVNGRWRIVVADAAPAGGLADLVAELLGLALCLRFGVEGADLYGLAREFASALLDSTPNSRPLTACA